MTPRFFKSSISVNIFIILTNLFKTFIHFFRKTSVMTAATLFLSPFLGSMLDFMGKRGMEDTLEKDDLTNISATSLHTLISSSEGGVTGDEEYFEVEGN